jgi:glucose-1-phosphate cytidylyltransferase
MKVVILAGGLGTRLAEETTIRPKPMVEIGGIPILCHIMKTYSYYGFNDFVICLGYKGHSIKEFFLNYFTISSDFTIDLEQNKVDIIDTKVDKWKVTLVDTGLKSMTGARIKKIQKFIKNERFMLTYGDGVADINITELLNFHNKSQKLLTITSVQPSGRFGALDIKEGIVNSFKEKPKGDGSWINTGYMVCEPEIFDYISDAESCIFEEEPMNNLAIAKQMAAYKHNGFWRPMDTLKDKLDLNNLWEANLAPWKK